MSFVVYPSVDISEGRCVRLLQGRFGTESVYSDDPVRVALGFGRAGARWLHIVDLDGAKTGERLNRELVLEVVTRSACPVQAGGGLRTLDDVEEVLAAGASRAVISTTALEDPVALRKACKRYGERIAVSLDVRGDKLSSHGWTVGSGIPFIDAVEQFEAAGVSFFIHTDIGRDGTMWGPNIDGVRGLAEVTDKPVVASGGIGSLDELRLVARMHTEGVRGAIIGRALYENKFNIGQANLAADEIFAGKEEPVLEGEAEGR
ncbi:MAG TPA: 1-(5-phosphoribosyl)-5-[(5-phosphoribosylamino)methylideneamino]imidazole-4-carboxamide isomerase [Actinomycetota bacterium]|nr:1-(5-phosphoribosyl)-5-[(5-phosphoribosylamino)methylideneamino]imidazole-4-carboxamide isomerase [Actinomycetota bacterium]